MPGFTDFKAIWPKFFSDVSYDYIKGPRHGSNIITDRGGFSPPPKSGEKLLHTCTLNNQCLVGILNRYCFIFIQKMAE